MIYVDSAIYKKPNGRKLYCHMIAESIEELHKFASSIGLGKHLFHNGAKFSHYDLTAEQRQLAVSAGATQITSKTLVRIARNDKKISS